DAEVRRLQLRGSARLSRYLTRLSHQGLEAANAVVSSRSGSPRRAEQREVALLTGSVGLAFSEDSDFDQLDDLGHRSGRDRFGHKVRVAPLTTGRQRVVALIMAALIVAAGTRELFFGSLPLVGQLAPLPAWSATWHHFVSGWQQAGVGTTAPASPAFGIVGIAGTALLGSMGTVQKVMLLGCIPLGALGFSRFMRPLVSPRARLVATICYLGLPLPYGALGTGRWDGLVAYAAFPFILTRLALAAGLAPFAGTVDRRWRSGPLGQIAVLGAIIAAASSFAPAVLPMVIVAAFALALGAVLAGARRDAHIVLSVAGRAAVVALVLSAPWVVGTALAGTHAVEIFGLPIAPSNAPGWGEVVRFAIGPAARSPLVWLMIAAAALPLALGKGIRLVWTARLWVLACASWGMAVAGSHGAMGSFTPSETVVLVPAAIAVAGGIGLGISSFENDLAGQAFGWRQLVSGGALIAVALGLLPVAAAAAGGRWGLPTSGVEQPLAFLNHPRGTGVYRVLWLGDPRALPVGGWSIEPGLAYALTSEGLPDATDVWTPAGPGPAATVARAVQLATSGGTVHLGRLLAAAGVRYVVVPDGLSPTEGNGTPSVAAPPPPGLRRALLDQNDLQVVPGELGVQVYENGESIPVTSQRAAPLPVPATPLHYPGPADVVGWQPVLSTMARGGPATGTIGAGAVYAGYAPAGSFSLTVNGHSVARQSALGWAGQYPDAPAGAATLSFDRVPYVPFFVLVELLGWSILALAVLGWRRWPIHRARRVAE
ncbi:MAG TPA: hypothetical protein VND70_01435, partial [Acidimicrobiales bacterium]|nr:hypothetical protein [Acidimicrobiales bacterium]